MALNGDIFKNLKEVLEAYGQTLVEKYQMGLIDKNSIASGRLLDSAKYIVNYEDGVYELSISLEEWWKYLEEGTLPHWPTVNAIRDWITVKQIVPYPDSKGKVPSVEQLAFLIGRKISQEGTDGRWILRDALEEMNPDWEKLIEEAIELDVRDEIDEILKLLIL